jgi:predicted nucleic acid-binding protein
MSGDELVVDTNVFINLSLGKFNIDPILQDKIIFVSIISEIAILGFQKISDDDDVSFFMQLLSTCHVVDLSQMVKMKSIDIKRKYKLKTPDAIVAATAVVLEKPLLTFDKDFLKIKELDLFLL